MMHLPARIIGTGSLLPGRAYETAEVVAALGRDDTAGRYERKSGIYRRHWAESGTLMAPLAADAIGAALEMAGMAATELSRIIMVRSVAGDLMFPATANRVAAALGLSGSCDCFDLNNACMGFLTAMDLAARCVATGMGPVAIVASEMGSRFIRQSEHRPYLVFGDAMAAAIIGRAGPQEGIEASYFGNDGTLPNDVFAEDPSLTGQREYIQFAKSSTEIFDIAFRAMAAGIEGVLARAGVCMGDVDWVLPHQPNGAMLDLMVERLGVDPARTVRVVQDVGSVGAASIALSLDRLLRSRAVRPGQRILLAGVGGGVSYGAVLYRVGDIAEKVEGMP
ncbi:MAG TPA: ketoacyl-ACP synthase III [Candidatus Xenobia bacterium]|jgi:3-oxoacyl-(acyl-carrier-protein) synthase III